MLAGYFQMDIYLFENRKCTTVLKHSLSADFSSCNQNDIPSMHSSLRLWYCISEQIWKLTKTLAYLVFFTDFISYLCSLKQCICLLETR